MDAITAVNSLVAKTAIQFLQRLSDPPHFRLSLKHRVALVPTETDYADFSVKHDRILTEAWRRGLARDLAVRLVEYACDAACDVSQDNRSICFIRLPVAIIGDEQFQADLERTVDDQKVDRARICLELPETPYGGPFPVRGLLRAVDRGFMLSLGNFGTGVCSYEFLMALPVSFVQIAPMFVSRLLTDQLSKEVVRSLNEMAHITARRTIGAGVDSAECIMMLMTLGVDYVEGPAIQPQ